MSIIIFVLLSLQVNANSIGIDSIVSCDFQNKIFEKDVDFKSYKFNCNANFKGATFIGNVSFNNAEFIKDLRLNGAVFFQQANFEGYFNKSVNFDSSVFHHELYLEDIIFEPGSSVSFKNSIFKEGIDFYREWLTQNVSFEKALFEGNSIIERISFTKGVSFKGCRFHGKMHFKDLHIDSVADFSSLDLNENSKISFENCEFPKYLDFSNNSIIYNEIDLTKCYSKSTPFTYINLYGTNVSKLHLNYLYFRLNLQKNEESEIETNEAIMIYEALLNNFRDHGELESYRLLDMEYQTYKDQCYLKITSKLNMWWWEFGYNKGLIFWHVLCFLFGITLVNFIFINVLQTQVYLIENIPEVIPLRFNFKEILLRLWYSFIYGAIIFFLFSLKIDKMRFYNKFGVIYIVVIYSLGIICIAYMANFVIQK